MRMPVLFGILLLTLLSGCSTLKQPPTAPLVIDPEQAMNLQQWSAQGRIGIRWADDSQSANLNWQQDQDRYRIRISGPLGQGGMSIDGNAQEVSLQRAGEPEIHRARTPEALMQQLLGWHLPLTQAQFWIRGIPAPSGAPHRYATTGSGFTQSGWRIEYPRLTQAVGRVLPEKLRLSREDMKITVIINEWEPGTDP
ncbi:outer membrane lipoprotein LolB [Marinobacterium halophilum]|uniref:Outer-membrane lipoprotein LolB n=1 Tax=Marinobacterium halophilum TaxID=267374 RepID=A0A2P8EQT5_9GAMM|nr:lipoprotein insertase outer membrane protein LolB [Marinobacterium halophilum]PSL11813.1 outer membrane lipoprotein LolB [Marinobacterium halophilum]